MAKTKTAEIIKAAEKARRAERRVTDAQRALGKAVKARDRADAYYLELVSQSLADRQRSAGKEGSELHA